LASMATPATRFNPNVVYAGKPHLIQLTALFRKALEREHRFSFPPGNDP
jgi:hypothetical protein